MNSSNDTKIISVNLSRQFVLKYYEIKIQLKTKNTNKNRLKIVTRYKIEK